MNAYFLLSCGSLLAAAALVGIAEASDSDTRDLDRPALVLQAGRTF